MAHQWKTEDLAAIREQLLSLRRRLQGDVNQLTDEALGANGREVVSKLSNTPLHMADVGSENYEQELTLELVQSEQLALDQVNAALSRLEAGTFGVCESCQAPISKTRLQALPYASRCIDCARQSEQSE